MESLVPAIVSLFVDLDLKFAPPKMTILSQLFGISKLIAHFMLKGKVLNEILDLNCIS